jgi:hypothetical protein
LRAHKKHGVVLENEPKYLNGRKLTDIKMVTTYARTSILEFTGILRSKNGGYAKPGEENIDLGIPKEDCISEPQSHAVPETSDDGKIL